MNQLNVNLPELPYAVSEAMNRLRINIKFCGKNTRKILLTSCQPNEGKSTISSYLWKMLGSIFQHSISRTNCGLGPITLIVPPDVKIETTFFSEKIFQHHTMQLPSKTAQKKNL